MAATTETGNYLLGHSMIRVKDPKESVDFYELLGMKLVDKEEEPKSGFDVYRLAYDYPSAPHHGKAVFDREGGVELLHTYGTEKDANFKVSSGNAEPNRGFGHLCISVDNIQAACQRLEDAGCKFQKKLTDGRMRNIAFVLDPNGYWVEVIARTPYEQTADVKETDLNTYLFNHQMIRVKDAEKSLKFYKDVMGMKLFRESPNSDFTLYFLGYPGKEGKKEWSADHEGFLELTWNHGTEKDENFKYFSGNEAPEGFGHINIIVDNLQAACKRFEDMNCTFEEKPEQGYSRDNATILDPDGYWVQVVQNNAVV